MNGVTPLGDAVVVVVPATPLGDAVVEVVPATPLGDAVVAPVSPGSIVPKGPKIDLKENNIRL